MTRHLQFSKSPELSKLANQMRPQAYREGSAVFASPLLERSLPPPCCHQAISSFFLQDLLNTDMQSIKLKASFL